MFSLPKRIVLQVAFPIAIRLQLVALCIELPIAFFLAFSILFPLCPAIHYSPLVLDSNGIPIAAYLSADDKWRFYADLQQLNPQLLQALIHKEDQYFYWHFGVNPFAVLRVFFLNTTRQRISAGASTITMQVVRLTQPRKRTYRNKLIEALQAIRLEITHSKAEILQLYVNLLPFGKNIEGVHAAARLYFNVAPSQLSLTQSIALSLIPNRPNRYRLLKLPCPLQPIVNRWLDFYKRKGTFPSSTITDAINEQLVFKRHRIPLLAPHFTHRLLNQRSPAYSSIIATNIDANLQQHIQAILQPNAHRLLNLGIENTAIVVLRNSDRAILSYIGSADFSRTAIQGQIDGVRQLRSPGSTLKPLLYAYACDRGELTPELRLADVLSDYQGYAPENYDQQFYGLVSARYALCQSLNIPAVSMLNSAGVDNFIQLCQRLNLFSADHTKKDASSKYGLSLILGGCEVRLLDLVNAYATLASFGSYRPIKWTNTELLQTRSEASIWSPAACFLTLTMLEDMQWNALSFHGQAPAHKSRFVWKTGTSYGRRDAWAVGCNTEYTVGVWAGNFHGLGSPALNGSDIAAPLLHKVFGLLPYSDRSFPKVGQVAQRLVCSYSGRPMGQNCPPQHAIQDWYIPAKTQIRQCDQHQVVWVSADKSVSFCQRCKPEDGCQTMTFENYSPDVLFHLQVNGETVAVPPPHYRNCPSLQTKQEQPLYIISPTNGAEVFLSDSSGGKLALEARSSIHSTHLYWFVNHQYIGSAAHSQPLFYTPKAGKQVISCVDEQGSTAKIEVDVKRY
jgi:penicillin-binding protein 1C